MNLKMLEGKLFGNEYHLIRLVCIPVVLKLITP